MPSKKKKLQIYLDADNEEFMFDDYVGNNPSQLVNKLIRAFASRFNNDPTVRTIFVDAVEEMINEEKGG